MKDAISDNLLALVCVVGAVIVAASGHDGWGWLLLVAILFGQL